MQWEKILIKKYILFAKIRPQNHQPRTLIGKNKLSRPSMNLKQEKKRWTHAFFSTIFSFIGLSLPLAVFALISSVLSVFFLLVGSFWQVASSVSPSNSIMDAILSIIASSTSLPSQTSRRVSNGPRDQPFENWSLSFSYRRLLESSSSLMQWMVVARSCSELANEFLRESTSLLFSFKSFSSCSHFDSKSLRVA